MTGSYLYMTLLGFGTDKREKAKENLNLFILKAPDNTNDKHKGNCIFLKTIKPHSKAIELLCSLSARKIGL